MKLISFDMDTHDFEVIFVVQETSGAVARLYEYFVLRNNQEVSEKTSLSPRLSESHL